MGPEIIAEFSVSQPMTGRYFGYKAARHFRFSTIANGGLR